MKTRVSRILLLAVVAALCALHPAVAQIQTATVTGGELEGVVKNDLASFKGIPFAAPPVGELRWRPPQPVKPWSGVRKADTFAPGPIQDAGMAALMGGRAEFSEDCLYLNVWTPAKSAGEKLPVMVWIYGGGFMSGLTSVPLYEGTKLARKGVVLVSIAYRLGPFGFLAHPDLSRESGKGSGCYGLMDQVAALRWVRDNIVHFGGDPVRVTIFGESAGGISVSMLTTIPAAKGLFQRAISQSGGSMAPVKRDNETGQSVPSLKLAEAAGKYFLSKLGANDIKAARALSAQAIQKGVVGLGMFWPVADGEMLRGDQYELYQAGKFNDTPVLIGSNSDEGAMFLHQGVTPAVFEKEARERLGPAAEGVLQAYPHATDAEAFRSTKDSIRESVFAWPTWAWAKLHSEKSRYKAFVYYFDHHKDASSHASEIAYVFRNLGGWGGTPKAEDTVLSDLVSSYWVNFARTGDPNGPGLPEWPAFDGKEMKAMILDRKPSARTLPNLEKIKTFDTYFTWRREQARTNGTGLN